MASVAAQNQGKFWQFHDLIFENYKDLSMEKFSQFAQKLNLNMPMFNRQMNSKETKDKITADFINGRDSGVTGTPALFINGRRVRDRSLEGLQKIINEELM